MQFCEQCNFIDSLIGLDGPAPIPRQVRWRFFPFLVVEGTVKHARCVLRSRSPNVYSWMQKQLSLKREGRTQNTVQQID